MTLHFHILHVSNYSKQTMNIEAESLILFYRWKIQALRGGGPQPTRVLLLGLCLFGRYLEHMFHAGHFAGLGEEDDG